MIPFVGIDFGASKAGTTAICYLQSEWLQVVQSIKGENADQFLRQQLDIIKPEQVFIDAPLSLPGGYFQMNDDYMFRRCDRELSAMSPMFLGGLTARAMKLKAELKRCEFFETYPTALARQLEIKSYKERPPVWNDLERCLPYPLKKPSSIHGYDAVLAWLSGYRHAKSEALEFGDEHEGVIVV